jgi:hypothetical protein
MTIRFARPYADRQLASYPSRIKKFSLPVLNEQAAPTELTERSKRFAIYGRPLRGRGNQPGEFISSTISTSVIANCKAKKSSALIEYSFSKF